MFALRILIDALFPPRETERLVRDRTASLPLLSPVLIEGAGLSCVALLPYRDSLVRACVLESKYHGNRNAFNVLGGVLADYLLEYLADKHLLTKHIVVVPIPLSRERRKMRGYNQVERIIEAARIRMPSDVWSTSPVLSRVRDTAPQTKISGQARSSNMEGAFAAGPLDPDAHYLLIDDVITTGATMLAASEALRAAGATDITALALAY